jgi:hypothetical protein
LEIEMYRASTEATASGNSGELDQTGGAPPLPRLDFTGNVEHSRSAGNYRMMSAHAKAIQAIPEIELNVEKRKKLVEAAGVEPASEKARRAKPTCVSGSGISAAA